MDDVETLAEQRVRAARQVKRLVLIRVRAASNIFELESLETNPERREELLGMAKTFARMLDSEVTVTSLGFLHRELLRAGAIGHEWDRAAFWAAGLERWRG